MMLQLIPISQPNINFRALLTTTKNVLGRDIEDILHNSILTTNQTSSIIPLLGEILEPGSNAYKHLSNPMLISEHLSFTFLLIAPQNIFPALSEWTHLTTLTVKTIQELIQLSIVSGTLASWKEAIINCSRNESTFDLRVFANQAMSLFEQAGYSQMFAGLDKVSMPDRTYCLK